MAPADPVVSTSAGRVRGRIEKGMAVFRGIPFAKPPIGPLRFQAPEPPAPWDDVREAKEFGPAAPQAVMLAEAGGQPARPADGSGEWLTVNVWTPDPAATRLPVVVWIYGGAYMFGGSGEPGYDGSPFARGGAVFVSLNYRLGMEGFALLPGAPANRGLLDAVAALTWVKENIEGFGGDPSNVTVFGESASAGVIAAMLAMDNAKGLFRRAIAQSVPGSFFTRELAGSITQAIAQQAGLPATYQALAAADPMDLVNAQMAVTGRMKEFPQWGGVSLTITPFSPVLDGEVLPRSPWRALLAGAASEVELLTGHNRDEYRLFLAMGGRLGNVTEDEAATTLATFAPAPDGAAAYKKAFPDADPSGMYELIFSDWLFRMPTLHLAQAHAASGGRTYLYELAAEARRPVRRLPRARRAARLRRDGAGAERDADRSQPARRVRRARRHDAPRVALVRRDRRPRLARLRHRAPRHADLRPAAGRRLLSRGDVHAPMGAPPVRRARPVRLTHPPPTPRAPPRPPPARLRAPRDPPPAGPKAHLGRQE